MADKGTVTMWPPSGGEPVEVLPSQAATMKGRGWRDHGPKRRKAQAAEGPPVEDPPAEVSE